MARSFGLSQPWIISVCGHKCCRWVRVWPLLYKYCIVVSFWQYAITTIYTHQYTSIYRRVALFRVHLLLRFFHLLRKIEAALKHFSCSFGAPSGWLNSTIGTQGQRSDLILNDQLMVKMIKIMVKWLRSTSGLRVGWMIITGWLRSWSNPGVWWEPCSHSAHDVCSHQKISHYWLDPQLWLDMFGIYSYLILLHDLTKDTSVRFLYISPVLSQWDRWDIFPTHGMQKNDHIFVIYSHKYS